MALYVTPAFELYLRVLERVKATGSITESGEIPHFPEPAFLSQLPFYL
jgi:hypothetical protein